eukprot:14793744-Heterocapsa_arctica.AAC.1
MSGSANSWRLRFSIRARAGVAPEVGAGPSAAGVDQVLGSPHTSLGGSPSSSRVAATCTSSLRASSTLVLGLLLPSAAISVASSSAGSKSACHLTVLVLAKRFARTRSMANALSTPSGAWMQFSSKASRYTASMHAHRESAT